MKNIIAPQSNDKDINKDNKLNPNLVEMDLWQKNEIAKNLVAQKREIRKKLSKNLKEKSSLLDNEAIDLTENINELSDREKTKLINKMQKSFKQRELMTIEDEIKDWGFDNVNDIKQIVEDDNNWYESTNTEIPYFNFLQDCYGAENLVNNTEKLNQFNLETDSIPKLKIIQTMSISDQIKCIHDKAYKEGTYPNFDKIFTKMALYSL